MLAGLSACIKDIKVDYPHGGGQLTLNSLIIPGDTIYATLSATLPYEEVALNPYFKDAFVTLYENDELVDTLRICHSYYRADAGDSVWQYCSYHPAKGGNRYQIKAFMPGYPAVDASVRIPGQAVITSVITEKDEFSGSPFEITIEDSPGEDNYYLLELRHDDPPFESRMAELSTDDPAVKLYAYFGIVRLPLDSQYGSQAFFSDQYFIEGQKKLKFRASFSNADDEVNHIILHSLSAEYYYYLQALAINNAVSENPFYEPVPIKTNVNNGFGMLGGASVTEIKLN